MEASLESIGKDDLKCIGLLGCGGFGSVSLYEHKESGETFALKEISKGYVVKHGMKASVVNEKTILFMLDSPFIIRCYATYSGRQTLSFLLEPALGGELYATYNRLGLHGSMRHCLFYAAGATLAIEHMHGKGVVWRGLKPEDLLLTATGHIKATDMGLAKVVQGGKTYTTCGTPDYFAPEVISSKGHGKAYDWWGLGILIFELMSGHPPFESAYPMQIYSKVMKGINKVDFPVACRGAVGDLIRALLKQGPEQRLPMLPGGLEDMKNHQWYCSNLFNWQAMANLTLEPPHKPRVKSTTDIGNFSASESDRPKMMEYHDDGSGWDREFASDPRSAGPLRSGASADEGGGWEPDVEPWAAGAESELRQRSVVTARDL